MISYCYGESQPMPTGSLRPILRRVGCDQCSKIGPPARDAQGARALVIDMGWIYLEKMPHEIEGSSYTALDICPSCQEVQR